MRKIASAVAVVALLVVAAPAGAAHHHRQRLAEKTAFLARDRAAVQIRRTSPGWEVVANYPDGPSCVRKSAVHVNCGVTAHRVDNEGIDEWVVYTVHVYAYQQGGYRFYTTNSGITEQPESS